MNGLLFVISSTIAFCFPSFRGKKGRGLRFFGVPDFVSFFLLVFAATVHSRQYFLTRPLKCLYNYLASKEMHPCTSFLIQDGVDATFRTKGNCL